MKTLLGAILIIILIVLLSSVLSATRLIPAITTAVPGLASTADQSLSNPTQEPYQQTLELAPEATINQTITQKAFRLPKGRHFVIRYVDADIATACANTMIHITTTAGGHMATFHLPITVPQDSGNCTEASASESIYISADSGTTVDVAASIDGENAPLVVTLSGYLVG